MNRFLKLMPMRPKPLASRTLMISYRSVPVGVAMSAAIPDMCAEFAVPPTLRLCFIHLHPLVMRIGLPYRSRAACSIRISSGFGVSYPHPHLQANSSDVKFFDSCAIILPKYPKIT